MVLGLRSKNRKGAPVQVDYLIQVLDIKPWPPSQSLRSVRSVLLQWENEDQNGSLISSVGDSNLEFSESFTLPVILRREKRAADKFQKNCLEFYLYELRTDKVAKGQLLGTSIINLADYGIIEEALTIASLVNFKKSFKNSLQSVLSIKFQPVGTNNSSNTSPKSSLSKVSLDKDGQESVADTLNQENEGEYEIDSFTDEDVSSHSSQTFATYTFEAAVASPSQSDKSGSESTTESRGWGNEQNAHPLEVEPAPAVTNTSSKYINRPHASSHSFSSKSLPSDVGYSVDNPSNLPRYTGRSTTSLGEKSIDLDFKSSSSMACQDKIEGSSTWTRGFDKKETSHDFQEKVSEAEVKFEGDAQLSVEGNSFNRPERSATSSDTYIQVALNSVQASCRSTRVNGLSRRKNDLVETRVAADVQPGTLDGKEKNELLEPGKEDNASEEGRQSSETLVGKFPQDAIRRQAIMRSQSLMSCKTTTKVHSSVETSGKLNHLKSAQLKFEPAKNNRLSNGSTEQMKKIYDFNGTSSSTTNNATTGRNDDFSHCKSEWESRIEMLEEELREAAAIEASLYSVVAEHGSSRNKVHAPARRLSRFYIHACKTGSQTKKASAARAAVSGLVLISKACGNDVPRLTFWMSNSTVLRAIVSQAVGKIQLSDGSSLKTTLGRGDLHGRLSKEGESFPTGEEYHHPVEEFDDWEDPEAFIVALEKVEAWIFSRIIESVWWQALTPHMQMQFPAAKARGKTTGSSSRNFREIRHGLGDEDQWSSSIELWKKAFKDAYDRLCPVRAAGHECGCLPVLARLVVEQLVDRLDVAMFNAILRESAEEMPTDPVSDPICDSKVLPVPAGKTSFGAGAQLKNFIGNWSRWLTDLFGIEDHELCEDTSGHGDDERLEHNKSFKPFHLLNALSDLMMLPFEMLANTSTRKEVCPTIGPPLIKRVLYNFVPDEFCPDPVPESVLDSLDSEDDLEVDADDCVTNFPYIGPPATYSPLPAASLKGLVGEVRSQEALHRISSSSLLRKSYTSDDELEELDSALTLVISDRGMPKGKAGRNVVRYQLLRQVWKDGEL